MRFEVRGVGWQAADAVVVLDSQYAAQRVGSTGEHIMLNLMAWHGRMLLNCSICIVR